MSEAERKASVPGEQEDGASAKAGKSRARTKGKKADDVGRALRTVYDSTLSEDIPDDFLDLLGKLD